MFLRKILYLIGVDKYSKSCVRDINSDEKIRSAADKGDSLDINMYLKMMLLTCSCVSLYADILYIFSFFI